MNELDLNEVDRDLKDDMSSAKRVLSTTQIVYLSSFFLLHQSHLSAFYVLYMTE